MIFGAILTALYIPGIPGCALQSRWDYLAIALPLMMLVGKSEPFRLTALHLLGALFVLWSAISLAWTSNLMDGAGELIELIILAMAFLYGARLENLDPIIKGMAIGLIPSAIVAVIQCFWLPDVVFRTSNTMSGLFVNGNTLGMVAALVLVGLFAGVVKWRHAGLKPHALSGSTPDARTIVLCVAPAVCLLLSQSRSALVALSLVVVAPALVRRKRWLTVGIALVAGAAGAIWMVRSGWHMSTVTERIGTWRDVLPALTWRGHGLGSLWTDYAFLNTTYDTAETRPEHLHNDWLEIVFELGLPGSLLCAGLVIAACRSRGDSTARSILAALAIGACAFFPLHLPVTGFLAALCLGHISRSGHDLRYMLARRRVRLLARENEPRCGDGHIVGQGSRSRFPA